MSDPNAYYRPFNDNPPPWFELIGWVVAAIAVIAAGSVLLGGR